MRRGWGIHRSPISRLPIQLLGLGEDDSMLQKRIPQLSTSLRTLWSSWRLTSLTKNDSGFWNFAAAAIVWEIWRERNNRIFNNLTRSS